MFSRKNRLPLPKIKSTSYQTYPIPMELWTQVLEIQRWKYYTIKVFKRIRHHNIETYPLSQRWKHYVTNLWNHYVISLWSHYVITALKILCSNPTPSYAPQLSFIPVLNPLNLLLITTVFKEYHIASQELPTVYIPIIDITDVIYHLTYRSVTKFNPSTPPTFSSSPCL